MIPIPLIRALLPGQNPFGFSAADTVMLGIAVLVVIGFLAGPTLARMAVTLSRKPWICAFVLFLTPIVLRLALLGQHPVPVPRVADDFSYLLLGDTLAHFRLANPIHPMRQFFEAVFVLQEPSYASIYPLGQGIALALGQMLFHQPWVGVLVTAGLLAALSYWMLRVWVPPVWALLGGFLVALQFGPLSPWMNTYWGGAVSAIGGCLIFGALPRLTGRRKRLPHPEPPTVGRERWDRHSACLLGLGLSLQLLTRPFEFLLILPVLLLFRPPKRAVAISALVLLPAAGLMLLHDKQVTGNWLTLPYQLSRDQYGIPASFTFQPNPKPHRELTIEQQVDYDDQVAVHDSTTFWPRLFTRIRFFRFFCFPALLLTLPMTIFLLRDRRIALSLVAIAALWIGDAFYPYFYPHYVAVATCLFVVLVVESIRRLRPSIATVLLVLTAGHFLFALTPADADDYWNALNARDPEQRASIAAILKNSPGGQLVFVRYGTPHRPQEWIHNEANIDKARVVWAVDRGDSENERLRRFYPDRTAWLIEPDAQPVRLSHYPSGEMKR